MAGGGAALARLRVEAAAVVAHAQPHAARRRARDGDLDAARLPVLERVADRLARGPVDQRGRLGAGRGGLLVDLQRGVDAGGRERAQQVAQRHLQPGRVEVRRVDLDQQRAQVADALAQAGGRVVEHGGVALVAAGARLGGERREAEGDAGEILDDAVVEVGGDLAALARGGLDRAGEQRLALAVVALQAALQRPGERQLEQQQHEQPAEQRRGEGAQQPRAVGADRAEALVDLEQHLRPVWRADRRVRLQQLALRSLVPVLGLAEVAQLGLGAALAEQLLLLVAELELSADQLGDVGVEHSAVLGPQLHAHDRSGQHLAEHEVVESSQRRSVAAQHAVAQPRRLDDAARRLDPLARVVLGLVDRYLPQREEAAADDHHERRQGAEHEAQEHAPHLAAPAVSAHGDGT